MASLIPKNGNDVVFTPDYLVDLCLDWLSNKDYFKSAKSILDPCCGNGAFFNKFPDSKNKFWCEITKGADFFEFKEEVDIIISNPPWSLTRKFLNHAMTVTKTIVFLIPINHIVGLKARMRDLDTAGFWLTDVLIINTPKEFPQSGFQLGLCVIRKVRERTTIFHF